MAKVILLRQDRLGDYHPIAQTTTEKLDAFLGNTPAAPNRPEAYAEMAWMLSNSVDSNWYENTKLWDLIPNESEMLSFRSSMMGDRFMIFSDNRTAITVETEAMGFSVVEPDMLGEVVQYDILEILLEEAFPGIPLFRHYTNSLGMSGEDGFTIKGSADVACDSYRINQMIDIKLEEFLESKGFVAEWQDPGTINFYFI
jgi:hypothetical protein